LLNLAQAMRGIDVYDPHLDELERRVREIMESRAGE
jgi:hypothetical protein